MWICGTSFVKGKQATQNAFTGLVSPLFIAFEEKHLNACQMCLISIAVMEIELKPTRGD